MNRTVLLTGTRAPATLDLARRLWREGVRVIGADSMRFPLGRFSRAFSAHHRVPAPRQDRTGFLRAIEDIATTERVDLVWPTCEEVLHVAAGREALEAVTSVFCPSLEVLDRLHHKLRFAEWAQRLGTDLLVPESLDARRVPQGGPWVWKPNYSRFAAHTRITPPDNVEGWMAQRFIDGQEFSSWALCVDGEVRVLTQYTCPVRSGKGAGCAFDPYWSQAVAAFVTEAAGALRYTGSLAFDFIIDESGQTFVLECNPRMTSGVHVLSHEASVMRLIDGSAEALPPTQRPSQLFLPTLLSSPRLAGSSPDVVNSPDDRRPVWGQGLALAEFAWRGLAGRRSLLEATTIDIEYDGR